MLLRNSRRSFLAGGMGLALALAIAPGAQAAEGTVVVYTAHKASIVDRLLPLFEAETGLKVDVVKMGTSDVIRRANAEKDNPAADVIWSITGSALDENAHLLEPYQSKHQGAIQQHFLGSQNWTPYTAVVYVVVANSKLVAPDQMPKSWADLADPKWKGQLASARADGSGSALQQLQTVLAIFGDKGWETYDSIAANFVLADSSSAVPHFVADSEASLGLTLEDNALEYVKGGAPVKTIYLSDGTAVAPDGVALVKGGKNPEGGKVFIDWALSKVTQEALVKEIGRRSVRTDVGGPEGTPALSELNLVSVKPLSEFGGTEAVLQRWRQAIGE
jgi:iron(III) transport system substrate-binding protein